MGGHYITSDVSFLPFSRCRRKSSSPFPASVYPFQTLFFVFQENKTISSLFFKIAPTKPNQALDNCGYI
ncbi:hypothetical protein L2E82_12154 [Cichorium intybus]|uniref:Uncharacterized protein n=1 Tax=Cichorium intybus TaxID=13427 RepID=A0ACB9GFY9_CICIN|nr:hypothetical protein L2E82_12154 [Cichorium intybus]